MTATIQDNIKDKYSELVQYISQLGHKTYFSYERKTELIIDVYSYFGDNILTVKLFQPIDREYEYNYHRLRISWAIPPNKCLGNNRWYLETNSQSVIFNTLLYDIINYKINNIGKETIDNSNLLIYEILKDWLKDCKIPPKEEKEIKTTLPLWRKVINLFMH